VEAAEEEEAAAAQAIGRDSGKGGAEGTGADAPYEFPAPDLEFAQGRMDDIARAFTSSGEINTEVILSHQRENGERMMGKITIEDAFTSRELLSDAIAFVRGQLITQTARCICICVPKSKIMYPLVWWAGNWPFSIEQDGVFLELVSREGIKTWFLPLESGGLNLLKGVELDASCNLLWSMPSLFPPGTKTPEWQEPPKVPVDDPWAEFFAQGAEEEAKKNKQ